GKAPAHVAQLAREAGVPVALVAGAIQADTSAFAAAASLTEIAGSTEAALKDPLRWLRDAGEILAR
ncbi:glycerate kinase, partial [Bacillus sp. SIMBA_005]